MVRVTENGESTLQPWSVPALSEDSNEAERCQLVGTTPAGTEGGTATDDPASSSLPWPWWRLAPRSDPPRGGWASSIASLNMGWNAFAAAGSSPAVRAPPASSSARGASPSTGPGRGGWVGTRGGPPTAGSLCPVSGRSCPVSSAVGMLRTPTVATASSETPSCDLFIRAPFRPASTASLTPAQPSSPPRLAAGPPGRSY